MCKKHLLFFIILVQLGCVAPRSLKKTSTFEKKLIQVNKAIIAKDYVGAYLVLSELENTTKFKGSSNFKSSILFNKAYCLMVQKKYNDAIKVLNKAISIYPKNIKNYILRAFVFKLIGKIDKSILDLKQVEQIAPNNSIIKYNLGCLYIDKGDYDSAVKKLNAAVKIQPDLKDGFINLAYALFHLGKYNDAISNLKKAVLLDNKDADIYLNMGLSYEKLHQYDNAISSYSEAIKINPQYISGYINRGVLFLSLGKNSLACNDFKKACELGICEEYKKLKEIMVCE
ncbi:hypothetical protein JCM12298_09490 [Desulfothermus naphthae]